ncbi:tRNA methyltransferase 11 homolog (Saccharomyces cerevisiae) [Seminavis robusta]|uniref:tRNA methyltransferase 11 homolog (Saccharomyces cerevisiae) n=1 Tax=Seminavis robusta TaxID=568900 RepID=A0A9N8DUA6_9STRA|nr:tRNA methyltransferase 11 homolog (Saccharomyces cerevisiae) [Seminavis robusta]|eukprot:Sro361_g126580.1 tRNA methyltransferase 11 homolog (Saccharomyces cerevisiae) (509) ;mRNA; r:47170-48973
MRLPCEGVMIILCSWQVFQMIPASGFSSQGVSVATVPRRKHMSRSATIESTPTNTEHHVGDRLSLPPRKLLIHWRGEDVEGYSFAFRHPELLGALAAVTNNPLLESHEDSSPIHFCNALNYNGESELPEVKLKAFNSAMQWVTHHGKAGLDGGGPWMISRNDIAVAASRCALIHTIYEVVAEGQSYSDLAVHAMENGGFEDMMTGGENQEDTWAVRVRHYGGEADSKKERRSGTRTRSCTMEKEALLALKPMLLKFGGGVDLKDPDCKINVFDGLDGTGSANKVLARKMGTGLPKLFSIAPATRICVTTTPLEPIAACSLCNIAGVSTDQTILDPYSGSCAILLAAAMMAPSCQTVGVDVAHDGLINRDHILQDFEFRGLARPKAIFRGDSIDPMVRDRARAAIGEEPFDHIITDPPYGIREKMDANAPSPLEDLFTALEHDRDRGRRLLKVGGRLVCFVPCNPTVDIQKVLPSQAKTERAGMKFLQSQEQPLNSGLSRWLVSYECTK